VSNPKSFYRSEAFGSPKLATDAENFWEPFVGRAARNLGSGARKNAATEFELSRTSEPSNVFSVASRSVENARIPSSAAAPT
jgi:hypothetical protein